MRVIHPYLVKSRTRGPIVDRVLVEAAAATTAATAEAFLLVLLKPLPRASTTVYDQMAMHKHFNHFHEIGSFRKKNSLSGPRSTNSCGILRRSSNAMEILEVC